jgi:hypothetical protein
LVLLARVNAHLAQYLFCKFALFFSLLLISAIFGYVVTKQSESAMRAEFQEKIDDLEKRIQRLEEV